MASEPSNPADRRAQDLPPMSYAGAAHEKPVAGETVRPADDWMKLNSSKSSTVHNKRRKKHNQSNGSIKHDDKSDDKPKLSASDLPMAKHQKEVEHGQPQIAGEEKEQEKPREKSKEKSLEIAPASGPDEKPKANAEKLTEKPKSKDEPVDNSASTNNLNPDSKLEVESEISNGTHLVTIPKTPDYDKSLALDAKENPHKPQPHPDSHNKAPPTTKVITRDRSASELTRGRKPAQGWDDSKIRFAPLNIPLKRRLQTAAVLFHSLTIAIGLSSFFLACCIPLLWPLLIVYLVYLQFSDAASNGSTNHRLEWLRRSKLYSLFGSYFPARLYRTVELDRSQKYLLGYHPHGIIAMGSFAAFCTESLGVGVLFPGLTFALTTLESNFKIPFYREYALGMGVISVGKRSVTNFLTRGGYDGRGQGKAVVIVVGGATESLDAKEGSMKLTLKSRKGFVKLAVQTGAHLVPVLCFGENELYSTITHDTNPEIYKFQVGFKKLFGWTIPIFHARGVFNYSGGLIPYRHPMHIIVGKPIEVVQHDTPDTEYVEKLQGKYIEELKRMFYDGREAFASNPKMEMEVV